MAAMNTMVGGGSGHTFCWCLCFVFVLLLLLLGCFCWCANGDECNGHKIKGIRDPTICPRNNVQISYKFTYVFLRLFCTRIFLEDTVEEVSLEEVGMLPIIGLFSATDPTVVQCAFKVGPTSIYLFDYILNGK